MWRSRSRTPVAIVLALFAIGVALVVILGLRSLGGNSSAATTSTGPKPSKAQQHAAGVLSAFVYRRGTWYTGGNVKACEPNWHQMPNIVAQLHCKAFGQPSVYTRFSTGSKASAYFKQLASQGRPASGSWGACQRHIPSASWKRTILGSEKESGQVAFRESSGRAWVVWTWPNMQTVAEASGSLSQRPAICRAWNLDA